MIRTAAKKRPKSKEIGEDLPTSMATISSRRRQMRPTNLKSITCFVVVAISVMFMCLSFIFSTEEAIIENLIADSKEEKEIKAVQIPDDTSTIQYNQITPTLSGCESFVYGDITPQPNVTSIFNCGSNDGKCKWFYPAKFLDGDCGLGREFNHNLQHMDDLRQKGELWKRGPPIVLPWVSLTPEVNYKLNGRTEPFPTQNLTFVHIHKTGGTSLVTSFSSLASRKYAKGKRFTTYMPPAGRSPLLRKPPRVTNPTNEGPPSTNTNPNPRFDPQSRNKQNWEDSSKHLNGIVKYQKTWGSTDSTLFAVIRDPAERFISAIGQATGATGSTNNGVAKVLVDECVKETSKETLSCFVNLVKTNSTWIEVHFTPMVLELSFATEFKDIPVAIFPFIEVPSLMYEIGANPNIKKKEGRKTRKFPVLADMTLEDYDDDSMRILCEVYRADVLFLWQIGYSTNCDSVVDFKEKDTFVLEDKTLQRGHRHLTE